MKNEENLYQVLSDLLNVEPTDLLLARLHFAFDYASMYNVVIDSDFILDWYMQEMDDLVKQPGVARAA